MRNRLDENDELFIDFCTFDDLFMIFRSSFELFWDIFLYKMITNQAYSESLKKA